MSSATATTDETLRVTDAQGNPRKPRDDWAFRTLCLAAVLTMMATLVALVESAILVLLLHLVQAQEELAVNRAGHYTLVNLINRLYAGP